MPCCESTACLQLSPLVFEGHCAYLVINAECRTNIRIPPVPVPTPAPSRGLLLRDFLAPEPGPGVPAVHEYLAGYQPLVDQYEGFNLLLFQLHPPSPSPALQAGETGSKWGQTEVGYLSNRPGPTLMDVHSPSRVPAPLPDEHGSKPVKVGHCHGLSNTPLSAPWPKVSKGEVRMDQTLREWTEEGENEDALVERLMGMLQ